MVWLDVSGFPEGGKGVCDSDSDARPHPEVHRHADVSFASQYAADTRCISLVVVRHRLETPAFA